MTRGLRNGRHPRLGFGGRRMVVPSPPQRLADPLCNRLTAPAGRRLNLQVFGVFEQDFRRLAAYTNSARCLRTSRPKPNADPSRSEHTSPLIPAGRHPPAMDMSLAQPAPPEPAPVRPHDAAYKLLFSFPEMVGDLLAGFVSSDVGDYTDSPLPHGRNLVAALVRLERSRSDADAEAVLGALDAWLSESGNDALRRAVGEWMRQVYAPGRPTAATGPDAENRTEVQTMLRDRVKEWMAKERADGQLELIRRMAARKFGGETAERLAERLEPVHDAERLAEIGEWLIECASGEELLERLERTHAFVPDGQRPKRQPAR